MIFCSASEPDALLLLPLLPSAWGVENNGNFDVVKIESALLELAHETLPYEKSDPYNFPCFGYGHGGYGSTR
jgi:hypothetical protein